MIRLFLFAALGLVMAACSTQTNSSKNEQSDQENPIIELRVKLVSDLDSLSEKLVDCGTLEVRQTFKFRVIRVIKGDYNSKYIMINIQCPLERITSKFLVKNRKYRFKLKRRKIVSRYTGDFEIV